MSSKYTKASDPPTSQKVDEDETMRLEELDEDLLEDETLTDPLPSSGLVPTHQPPHLPLDIKSFAGPLATNFSFGTLTGM